MHVFSRTDDILEEAGKVKRDFPSPFDLSNAARRTTDASFCARGVTMFEVEHCSFKAIHISLSS